MTIFKVIGDWAENLIDESLEKDPFTVTLLKSAGVGAMEGTILGCAAVGAIQIGKQIINTIIKK